jgi:hypothetical protein
MRTCGGGDRFPRRQNAPDRHRQRLRRRDGRLNVHEAVEQLAVRSRYARRNPETSFLQRPALRLLGASTLPLLVLAFVATAFVACKDSDDDDSSSDAGAHDASTTHDGSTGTPVSPLDASPGADAAASTDAASGGDGGTGASDAGNEGGGPVGDGGNDVTGVDGTQTVFAAKDGISGDTTDGEDSYWDGTSTTIFLTSFTGACDDITDDTVAPNTVDVFLQLAVNPQVDDEDGFTGSAVSGAGTFTVTENPTAGQNAAQGEVDAYDEQCDFTKDVLESGTVTITARTTTGITGTIDAMTEQGTHLTGQFSTAACASVGNIGGDSVMCQLGH